MSATEQLSDSPILRTKLYRPPVAPDLVARDHLLEKLEAGSRLPLTLVAAPAGYGKSTLVSHWLETSDAACAWLSLEETESEPRVFLEYLVAAVRGLYPEACPEVRALLRANDLPPPALVAARLTNDLDRIEDRFVLALDDYHEITDLAIHDVVDFVVSQALRSLPGALVLRFRTLTDSSTSRIDMDTLRNDLRYGLRALRRAPTFAAVATLTLGLAVGVNTSVFSLVSAIVFADLPMQDAETVAIVRSVNPELGVELGGMSPADFLDLRDQAGSFESLEALRRRPWVMTGLERPERIEGMVVTVGTLETWRLPPVLGRGFAADEGAEGANPVALLALPSSACTRLAPRTGSSLRLRPRGTPAAQPLQSFAPSRA